MSSARLIVNADDLGLTKGQNCAIAEAYSNGILTSASLMACGLAFGDAVERARSLPGLGIGVHLTLLEGAPVLPATEVPDLVDEDGKFRLSWAGLFHRLAMGQIRLEQVRREWRAQIHKVMVTGLPVTHFDSHKHIHMHPQLLEVALSLADEFGISRMRLSRPIHVTLQAKLTFPLGLLAVWAQWRASRQGVHTPDALLGLESSGKMTEVRVLRALEHPWQGTRELMMHPAHPDAALDRLLTEGYGWIAEYRFADELAALCAVEVRAMLTRFGIELVSYGAL